MFIFYHKSQRGHRNNNHIYAHKSWSHRASLQGIKELPGILIDCPGTKNLDRQARYQGVAGDLHMSAGYQELISKVYRSLSSLTGYKGVAGHLDKLVRYKDVTDLSLSFPTLFFNFCNISISIFWSVYETGTIHNLIMHKPIKFQSPDTECSLAFRLIASSFIGARIASSGPVSGCLVPCPMVGG